MVQSQVIILACTIGSSALISLIAAICCLISRRRTNKQRYQDIEQTQEQPVRIFAIEKGKVITIPESQRNHSIRGLRWPTSLSIKSGDRPSSKRGAGRRSAGVDVIRDPVPPIPRRAPRDPGNQATVKTPVYSHRTAPRIQNRSQPQTQPLKEKKQSLRDEKVPPTPMSYDTIIADSIKKAYSGVSLPRRSHEQASTQANTQVNTQANTQVNTPLPSKQTHDVSSAGIARPHTAYHRIPSTAFFQEPQTPGSQMSSSMVDSISWKESMMPESVPMPMPAPVTSWPPPRVDSQNPKTSDSTPPKLSAGLPTPVNANKALPKSPAPSLRFAPVPTAKVRPITRPVAQKVQKPNAHPRTRAPTGRVNPTPQVAPIAPVINMSTKPKATTNPTPSANPILDAQPTSGTKATPVAAPVIVVPRETKTTSGTKSAAKIAKPKPAPMFPSTTKVNANVKGNATVGVPSNIRINTKPKANATKKTNASIMKPVPVRTRPIGPSVIRTNPLPAHVLESFQTYQIAQPDPKKKDPKKKTQEEKLTRMSSKPDGTPQLVLEIPSLDFHSLRSAKSVEEGKLKAPQVASSNASVLSFGSSHISPRTSLRRSRLGLSAAMTSDEAPPALPPLSFPFSPEMMNGTTSTEPPPTLPPLNFNLSSDKVNVVAPAEKPPTLMNHIEGPPRLNTSFEGPPALSPSSFKPSPTFEGRRARRPAVINTEDTWKDKPLPSPKEGSPKPIVSPLTPE